MSNVKTVRYYCPGVKSRAISRLCSFWASVFHTTLDVCLSGLSKTKKQSHVAAANHSDSSTSAHHPASANHSASAHHSAETHGSHPRETHIWGPSVWEIDEKFGALPVAQCGTMAEVRSSKVEDVWTICNRKPSGSPVHMAGSCCFSWTSNAS